MDTLLSVKNLKTYFRVKRGVLRAVDNVSFDIKRGEVFCLVGESGCGKSITALSIMRLIPYPGEIVSGEILFDGVDLLKLPEEEMEKIRGKRIGMIFQDPHTSLDPSYTVGWQVEEAILLHKMIKEVSKLAVNLLKKVGIPAAEKRYREYPHQLSGGLKQRAMIGIAISNSPELLIADEPTTALDVTIQAQIVDLMLKLREENGISILLITHDMGLVAEACDRLAVMYAGKIVEKGSVEEIFSEPLHPYTKALLRCVPRPDKDVEKLVAIPGTVPEFPPASGCRFADRCPMARKECFEITPEEVNMGNGHRVACHLYG